MSEFQHLGPYRVEAKLGQGGMGTVYRGVHVNTGQHVAIKVLSSQMSHEARFRRRFDAEIETLKKLNHPNIVRLIGFGEEQGSLFYSMELVEGPSLLEHLRKVKRLDWDTTIGFAIEICAALKHAHDLGVIHRDLKPANLLLEPEGRLKLTDFGIAKLFGAGEQTAAGAVLGTADYMAPEQATGGPITPRTDLYALGSLMYACLVGRPPFGGRNLTQVVHGLKHESPAPIDLVLPDVPAELAELVHELLEKTPEDRPPTALSVGKRLRAMRVGLRRRGEQTHFDVATPTIPEEEVPPPARPQPPASSPSVASIPTAAEDAAQLPTGLEPGMAPTIASQAGRSPEATIRERDAPGKPNRPPEQSAGRPALAPRDSDGTEPDRHAGSVPRGESARTGSRFETVSLEPRGGDGDSDQHDRMDPRQWVSILGLLVMLVAAIGIVVWMVRTPSADEILAEIRQAEAEGDEYAYEAAAEQFVRVYPKDPRAAQFRESLVSGGVDAMARRLRRQATMLGGIDRLNPAEQKWLEAMDNRNRRPARSAQALRHWLDVFGRPEIQLQMDSDEKTLSRLTELARTEVERLQARDAEDDHRHDWLRAYISRGMNVLQGEDRRRFLRSAREMFGEEEWAQGVLPE